MVPPNLFQYIASSAFHTQPALILPIAICENPLSSQVDESWTEMWMKPIASFPMASRNSSKWYESHPITQIIKSPEWWQWRGAGGHHASVL